MPFNIFTIRKSQFDVLASDFLGCLLETFSAAFMKQLHILLLQQATMLMIRHKFSIKY